MGINIENKECLSCKDVKTLGLDNLNITQTDVYPNQA